MAWKRESTLGEGASGRVSLATLQQESIGGSDLPRIFAVKSAPVSKSSSLMEEKDLLQKFQSCSSIIRYFGEETTVENGEHIYNLLLEFAHGGSLAGRLATKSKGLPGQMVSLYTKSILTALSYMHKQGYVHCDVKPHNILLDEAKIAKLADFGSARKPGPGDFGGTPVYAAPETIFQQEYEPASDIWSPGCTILHLLSGKLPWIEENDKEVWALMYRIGFTDELPEIPAEISSSAADFLKKCLIKDPQQRWTAEMLLSHPFVLNAASRKGSEEKARQHKKALSHSLSTRRQRWLPYAKLPICPLGA